MRNQNFIDGRWVASASAERLDVVNPATEERLGATPMGDVRDVARAVAAARAAAPGWAATPRTECVDALPEMAIAQEEDFGPVLAIMGYTDEDGAVRIVNGTVYGLSSGVWSRDTSRAERVAPRLRSGHVVINCAPLNVQAPFGGMGLSGLGREYGRHGLEEYFQTQSLQGAIVASTSDVSRPASKNRITDR